MGQEYLFDNENEFKQKLQELAKDGVGCDSIDIFTPYPVNGVDEIIGEPPSMVKVFTLLGASSGFVAGLILTIYTVKAWPLITGGKPLISLPPFLIIAYVLTILFGAIATFSGFLFFARLPSFENILPEKEYGNQFAVLVTTKEN